MWMDSETEPFRFKRTQKDNGREDLDLDSKVEPEHC